MTATSVLWWFIFIFPSSIHQPSARWFAGVVTQPMRKFAVCSARTWSKQSPVKRHGQQRWYPLLSKIFLCFSQIPPLLLLHRVLGELNRFCRSVSSLPGVSLCGHVFMGWRQWTCWEGGFPTEMRCSAPANLLGAVSKWPKARISFPHPILWFAALKRQVLSPVEEWNVCVNNVTTPFTPHLYVTELAW